MKSTIYLIITMLMVSLVYADITGSETMTRTGPTDVNTGETFQITYDTHGTTGDWGVSIEDNVVGGCVFPSGKTTYRDVLISDAGTSRTISITAPSTETACTFFGDYKYGEAAIKNFPDLVITIGNPVCVPDWSCSYSAWSDATNNCGTRTQTCTDGNGCQADTTDTETATCPPECTTDSDCATGEICSSGSCVVDTSEPDECQFWEEDKDGECKINQSMVFIGIALFFAAMMFK